MNAHTDTVTITGLHSLIWSEPTQHHHRLGVQANGQAFSVDLFRVGGTWFSLATNDGGKALHSGVLGVGDENPGTMFLAGVGDILEAVRPDLLPQRFYQHPEATT